MSTFKLDRQQPQIDQPLCGSGFGADKNQSGFTLIELMIVTVIIAIIAAFAYPSYMDSVQKSRRSDAKSYLMHLAARQEQYFNDNKRYATTTAELLGLAAGNVSGNKSPEGYYIVKITDNTPADGDETNTITSNFLITATPVASGPQAKDTTCASLTYSSLSIKGSTPAGSKCW